jgi:glutamine amidotransferase
MIAIIDYGMGNLASVYKAVRYAGYDPKVTADPVMVSKADLIILPGVGAMAQAMNNLERSGLTEPLLRSVEDGKPFLGICLGYQMLFESSEEGMGEGQPAVRGLGLLKGKVLKFADMPRIKVPHMGWNKLSVRNSSYLEGGEFMYFVHSFYPKPEDYDSITSTTRHGVQFAASVEMNNIFATQFHPEKSGTAGIQLLKKWLSANAGPGSLGIGTGSGRTAK